MFRIKEYSATKPSKDMDPGLKIIVSAFCHRTSDIERPESQWRWMWSIAWTASFKFGMSDMSPLRLGLSIE